MKNIFMDVIKRGGFDLSGLLAKIDAYHIEGKLTDAEREELILAAREAANPMDGVDVLKKLNELEHRVRALENVEPDPEDPDEPETYPEYVPGKWYYAGDKVSFEGLNYVCTAPDGVVCTWSPAEYPAYWEQIV